MNLIILILTRLVEFYSFLLVVYALLSWFPNAYDSALGRFVSQLVEPLLKPFRSLNLQFAGLDFAIILVIILLNVLKAFLMNLVVY